MEIPQIGLGTFRLKGLEAQASVVAGLDLGYRHIDTAQIYDNEEAVGVALRQSAVDRKDIFLTTKIWTSNLSGKNLIPSLQESLKKLGTDNVDLTLIHWPSPKDEVPLHETLEALQEAVVMGLTKNIGLSNFTVAQMKQAIEIVGTEALLTNQIEVHPFLQNQKVIDFCQTHGIKVTAYMPLAYGKVMTDEVLQKIAHKYETTPAEIALAWLLDRGMIVIPSSTKRKNLLSNLKVRKGLLTAQDFEAIEQLDRGERLANPDFSPIWD
ncbi:2,5-didehydrogluconate reductase DkgB [Bdellovibrio bacteriovorus]|uniref:2,5-didehydrogluconate reductase DkgB n=1 Tax=Bdellovibrio bacteriovorus TaxID=959 RepID=UPI0021D2FC1A|nr:2,5-didehydrogluconate reductase DkgB [Bdellovibrio bacteriovorus]UXR66088.1 2,5-didehydrogluconate reductase DkgB [Bdellovibrio bacteriovorus]